QPRTGRQLAGAAAALLRGAAAGAGHRRRQRRRLRPDRGSAGRSLGFRAARPRGPPAGCGHPGRSACARGLGARRARPGRAARAAARRRGPGPVGHRQGPRRRCGGGLAAGARRTRGAGGGWRRTPRLRPQARWPAVDRAGRSLAGGRGAVRRRRGGGQAARGAALRPRPRRRRRGNLRGLLAPLHARRPELLPHHRSPQRRPRRRGPRGGHGGGRHGPGGGCLGHRADRAWPDAGPRPGRGARHRRPLRDAHRRRRARTGQRRLQAAARAVIARVLPTASRAVQALVIAGLAAAALSLAPLHGEGWWQGLPSTGQAWMAGLLVAAYLGGSAVILGRSRRRAAAVADTAATGTPNADDWLVVHASQTGQAVEFAQRTVASLAAAGQRAQLRPIASVDAATLAAARRALFVASTTGEGDAPDPAAGFIRDTMRPGVALPGLRHAVLALGDRSYDNYCAFGHELDRWLRGAGAEPLFDLVEVDNGDPAALRHWQHHLGVAAGATGLPDWEPAAFGRWTLASRRRLNPGSAGGAVYEILLAPAPGEA